MKENYMLYAFFLLVLHLFMQQYINGKLMSELTVHYDRCW